jgi:hypothetical protein
MITRIPLKVNTTKSPRKFADGDDQCLIPFRIGTFSIASDAKRQTNKS